MQEYGRLVKTLFILRYLESPDYRRRIHTQLNKGEALHALRQFLFFANQGYIRRHQPEDQANQASCLNLVTNAVVTWNTIYMMAALDALTAPAAEAEIRIATAGPMTGPTAWIGERVQHGELLGLLSSVLNS